jgi:nitroimidazol reductase NimA-like FMN-containing flavoprotein (pyridoxamine 5'-phosphate oxidase superfamily)
MRLVDNRSGLQVLDRRQCLDLLESQDVGRVAVVVGNAPMIFPINYLVDEGTIVFRTAEGTKLSGAGNGFRMCFEIDGIDRGAREGWSVVASGTGRTIVEPNELARVRALPLEPWAQGDKPYWVRIRPETITGRRVARG